MAIQDPDAEILTQRYGQEMRVRDLAQSPAEEILTQTSCTRDLHTLICISAPTGFCWGNLKHLAQEIIQRSCARSAYTEILRKWSYKILMQRSCASGSTGSWRREPEREILDKRSAHTETLHKWSDGILTQTS